MSEDVVRLAMRRMADQDGEQWILDIDVSVEPLDGRTPPPDSAPFPGLITRWAAFLYA